MDFSWTFRGFFVDFIFIFTNHDNVVPETKSVASVVDRESAFLLSPSVVYRKHVEKEGTQGGQ